MGGHPDGTLAFRWVTAGVYVLSCGIAFGPLWLRIFLLSFVCFFLFFFSYFVLQWAYELPCQGKLPEFHFISIVGCIRVSGLSFIC